MNEITKNMIQHWLSKLGIRLLKAKRYRFDHDPSNYPEMQASTKPVIFDVGANIGQTAIDFARSFPSAEIHAFEPFATVYQTMERNVKCWPNIIPHHLAMGEEATTIQTKKVVSDCVQTTRIRAAGEDDADLEIVTISTIDEFCSINQIERIGLLKVDAEGWDLKVLIGASTMLRNGAVDAVLTEASIRPGDQQHASYAEIAVFMQQFGFGLYSLYSIHHKRQGDLDYFNALFKTSRPYVHL